MIYICAYVCSEEKGRLNGSGLREFLKFYMNMKGLIMEKSHMKCHELLLCWIFSGLVQQKQGTGWLRSVGSIQL